MEIIREGKKTIFKPRNEKELKAAAMECAIRRGKVAEKNIKVLDKAAVQYSKNLDLLLNKKTLQELDDARIITEQQIAQLEDFPHSYEGRKERALEHQKKLLLNIERRIENYRATPESKNVIISLPEEFKTEIAKKIFARGVEAGYFEQRGEGFKSQVGKEELAWFAYKFNIRVLGKSRGKRGKEAKRNQFNWDIFHKAFGVDKLGQEYNKIKQYDEMKANTKFQHITKLFD